MDARLDHIVADLVNANRILSRHGVVDAYGHVSVRNPEDPSQLLISRSKAPGLVVTDDIVAIDVDTGDSVNAQGTYIERHIHAAIYRARPDVAAVVHAHSGSLLPFGLIGRPLRPLVHTSSFLVEGCAMFEIRDASPDRDTMLVDAPDIGDALAASLGMAGMVLMRGHGATIVGGSIPDVVYRAIYAGHAAALELTLDGRNPRYLEEREARDAWAAQQRTLSRPWELWSAEIAGNVSTTQNKRR